MKKIKYLSFIVTLVLSCYAGLYGQPEPPSEPPEEPQEPVQKVLSIEELIANLKSPDNKKRMEAAMQLRDFEGDEEKLKIISPPLLQALKDEKDKGVKYLIIETLGILKIPEAIEPIIEIALSKSGEEGHRIIAIRSLVTVGDNSCCKKLAPVLYDEKDNVASYAVWALATLAFDDYMQELFNALPKVKPITRKEILKYIGRTDDEKTIKVLINATKDESEEVAMYAIKTLSEYDKTEEIEKILLETLKDNRQNVKIAGLRALRNFETEKAIAVLLKTYKEEKEQLKQAAFSLLIQIPDKTIMPIMIEALKEKDDLIRLMAIEGIITSKDPTTLPILIDLYKNKENNERIRFSAFNGILNFEDPSILPLLIESLNETDPNIRALAVKKLARIGGEEVIKNLKEFIKKETDEKIKELAQKAIRRIKNRFSSPAKEPEKEE